MLLDALVAEAARRGVGLCLNVRHDNPARRLYERVGFRLVPGSGVPNRVGGTSFGCCGPRLGNNGRAPPLAPAGWSRSRPLGLSERGCVWLRCSIDLGELE